MSLYSPRVCVKHEDFVVVANDYLEPNLSVLDALKCLLYIFDVITNSRRLVLDQLLSRYELLADYFRLFGVKIDQNTAYVRKWVVVGLASLLLGIVAQDNEDTSSIHCPAIHGPSIAQFCRDVDYLLNADMF